jgi:hypothetical protein
VAHDQDSDRPLSSSRPERSGAPGRVGTERDAPDPGFATARRIAGAQAAFASRGVRLSVRRLPPTVHGEGDDGLVAAVIRIARDHVSGYIGDGSNRSPAVHRLDSARLFRLELLGWHPTHPALIDDLDHGHYVRERSARPSHPRWARGSQSVDEYA